MMPFWTGAWTSRMTILEWDFAPSQNPGWWVVITTFSEGPAEEASVERRDLVSFAHDDGMLEFLS